MSLFIKRTSRNFFKGLLGPYYYLIFERYVWDHNSAFNGQMMRKRIFSELMGKCEIRAIVETGAWLGNTTEFFLRNSEVPVYACDINRQNYFFCKFRLAKFRRCHMFHKDSREFLDMLQKISAMPKSKTFFYLDAHGAKDRPLLSEVSIICRNWSESIIMIDDFAVPDDPGYGYNDYGEGNVFNLGYLSALIKAYNLRIFFPSIGSDRETGNKRGWVVLSMPGIALDKLNSIAFLRNHAK